MTLQDILITKITKFEDGWKKVYELNEINPNLFVSYLSNISVSDIGETVLTVLEWIKSIDDSKTTKTSYKLSKEIMLSQLNQAQTQLDSILSGGYDKIVPFTIHLNQLLVSLYPMTFLNNYDKSSATLSADLASAIASIKTLETELKDIKELHEDVITLKETATSYSQTLKGLSDDCDTKKTNIETIQKDVEAIKKQANLDMQTFGENKIKIDAFSAQVDSLEEGNNKIYLELQKNEKYSQEVAKKIEKVLPGATSYGLSEAFYSKATAIASSKKGWLALFVASLIWLFLSIMVSSEYISKTEDFWRNILQRLPFVAPSIWLGWFSARSFGHATRLQEKYAYKEAISKAFEGYKHQMSTMSSTKMDGKLDTELSLLALKVLEENPSHVFERGFGDETPFNGIIRAIFCKKKNTPEG